MINNAIKSGTPMRGAYLRDFMQIFELALFSLLYYMRFLFDDVSKFYYVDYLYLVFCVFFVSVKY